jgi:glyoxylase-like metal-dependent hydrolase (beta-lactamase superfamily II)
MTDHTAAPTMPEDVSPPVVTAAPREIAEGVYVIPDGRVPLVPNIGIILGDRAALVVDTGFGPRSGANAHTAAKELAGDRQLLLTLTHFHPEHGFGAQAFTDTTLLYNRAQHEEFHQKAPGYLEQFRGFSEDAARELEGVEFVEPQIVYDEGCDIDLGGRLIQLRSRGPAHSRGDQTIFLPAERILFAGDLVEDRFLPLFPYFPPYDVDVDGQRWMAVLDDLKGLEPETVVTGHGEIGGPELIDAYRTYIQWLQSETLRLSAEGKTPEEIIGRLTQLVSERYADWDREPWRVATAVQSFLAR